MNLTFYIKKYRTPFSRFLTPFFCSGVVTAITLAMYSGISLGSKEIQDINILHNPGVSKNLDSPSGLHLVSAWASSSMIVIAIFFATIAVCLYVIWQRLAFFIPRRRKLLLLLVSAVSLLGAFLSVKDMGNMPLFVWPVKALFDSYEGLVRIPITFWMDVLASWETVLLIIAFGSLCMTNGQPASKEDVSKRKHFATLLLYLSGITLAIGVLEFDLLFRLAGNTKTLALSTTQVADLRNGLTVLAGTSCSLLIAAIFIPTVLLIKQDDDSIPMKKVNRENDNQNQESKTESLLEWNRNKIGKFIAVLLPIITGWLSEPISKLLSSIFEL